MSAARQRAGLFATRGLLVAVAASFLVFVTPRPLAIGSAIVAGVTLVAVLIAVAIWVFMTRPGMSYFAVGPTDYLGRAKESTIDHIAAQIAAVLLALLAVVFWMVWLGLRASKA